MKISFRSAVMICGFIATVFYFFHPIVATAMTAMYLMHRRIMRRAEEVPKMLTTIPTFSKDSNGSNYTSEYWDKKQHERNFKHLKDSREMTGDI